MESMKSDDRSLLLVVPLRAPIPRSDFGESTLDRRPHPRRTLMIAATPSTNLVITDEHAAAATPA
jgi:hypothetical protein